MKLKFIPLIIISIALFGMPSCKKKKKDPTPTKKDNPSDQSGGSTADDAMDDVRDLINNNIGGGSNKRTSSVAAYNLPCGVVSIDSTTNNTNGKKIYKVNYGQNTPCGYKYKSGTVHFELVSGTKFSDMGAIYKVTFVNYTVEVRANNQTVAVTGTSYVTNTSGGYVWEAITASKTIVHKIRGLFNVTFNGGETRPRNKFETRTWSSTNGWAGLTFTADGDTTINSVKVMETGKTYDGNFDYQTEISTPFSWSNCGATYAGPYVLKTGNAKINVTIAAVSPTYYNITAGYNMNLQDLSATPTVANDCNSNAYKIDLVIGTNTSTEYQLY